MPKTNVIFTKRNEGGLFDEVGNEVLIGDGTNTLAVNPDGSINVSTGGGSTVVNLDELGIIDSGNSTTTPLLASAVFTGIGIDTLNFSAIIISIFADEVSATDGLEFQFSNDNAVWYTTDAYTYLNNSSHAIYSLQTAEQYFRVKYTNGLVDQTDVHISTSLKQVSGVASSHRVSDDLSHGEVDAQLTKSIIAAQRPTGEYTNIQATPEGRLEVSVVTPVGVLPVSQLTTLHDGKILNRMPTEILETDGTGTGTYADNKYNMSVTAGQWEIIQSTRLMPYFSGKPQKIELTFDGFAPQANVTKRVGYFSSSIVSPYTATLDGLWLESSNGTISIKAQRNGVTTVDADITTWSNFKNLGDYQSMSHWDNFTVVEFNFLWLGGAYIELRLVTESGFVTAHSVVYAGTSPDIFIMSPNHPVRYEIRSTTGVGDFRYICNQVATSGSVNESGRSKAIDTGHLAITMPTIGVKYPLLATRKQLSNRDNTVKINNLDIMVASNDRLRWTLEINPTLSAPLTYTDVPNSSAREASGNGVITVSAAGIILSSGYLEQGGKIDPSIFIANYLSLLSSRIDGTMDEYILCVTPITTNCAVFGAMNYLEG